MLRDRCIGHLSEDDFKSVIALTPLVSIDLVIRNNSGQVLLGRRTTSPAKGFWFVPGGRIKKNESLENAFIRLCFSELGLMASIYQATYLGLYEHFYEDNVYSSPNKSLSTHYVVNCFEYRLTNDLEQLPNEQHSEYQWFDEPSILRNGSVHMHTKWYFNKDKGFV